MWSRVCHFFDLRLRNYASKKRRRGFTLIELILSLAISSVLLVLFSQIYVNLLQLYNRTYNMVQVQGQVDQILHQITYKIQWSDSVVITGNDVTISDTAGDVSVYRYNPTLDTLSLSQNGGTFQKLHADEYFIRVFEVDSRNPSGASVPGYEVTIQVEFRPKIANGVPYTYQAQTASVPRNYVLAAAGANPPTPTSGGPVPTNTLTPTPGATSTPGPTATLAPTSTPAPTLAPTSTPAPTATRTPTPTPTSANVNLIANAGFESGTANWTFFTDGTANFATVAPGSVGSFAGRVTVTNAGTNTQLYQTNFTLQPNTLYRLEYTARASANTTMRTYIHQHATPFTNYGLDVTTSLTTTFQTFSHQFTTTGFSSPTTDTRLRFRFTTNRTFYIDDVKLYRL